MYYYLDKFSIISSQKIKLWILIESLIKTLSMRYPQQMFSRRNIMTEKLLKQCQTHSQQYKADLDIGHVLRALSPRHSFINKCPLSRDYCSDVLWHVAQMFPLWVYLDSVLSKSATIWKIGIKINYGKENIYVFFKLLIVTYFNPLHTNVLFLQDW